MNTKLLAGVTALVLFAGGEVLAQVTTVEIAPEQRTRIKEYIVKERVRPVTVKERIAVGTRLPSDIELQPVPSTWGPSVSKYRYVYSNDHVYLVEPSNRTVIEEID
jgi:hypothetical protein